MGQKNGGTAFPMQDPGTIHVYAMAAIEGVVDADERERAYTKAKAEAVGGMTLRDYFAGKALATIAGYASEDLSTWMPEDFANHAYTVADAMLKARTAQPE